MEKVTSAYLHVKGMNFKMSKTTIAYLLKGLAIGLLVLAGTFPANDWAFSRGIDPPLMWVYNYIFEHGLNIGKHIIFPHGPLVFFTYPLAENILLATLVTSMLKIALVFNLLRLTDKAGGAKWAFVFILSYFISAFAGFMHLILINIILLYINYYNLEKWPYKLSAFVLTAFAFFVKSYVAIISGVLCFSFLAYYFLKDRDLKKSGFDVLVVFGLIILFRLLMYGSFSGLIDYVVGMYNLAGDNSSAVSFYPYNNWWILSIFLLIIFFIPFIDRTKKGLFYGSLISLSLFAAWKHGMAREDIYHMIGFLIYIIIFLSVFILFHNQKHFRNILLSVVAIFLLSINMKHSVNYDSPRIELLGTNNLIDFISDFTGLKKRLNEESLKNISVNRLPQHILDSIGSQTADVYPWDYSIIPANNLKWQPRVVLHSYASYTEWLDSKNAAHFESENAPEFFIWEKLTGINGGNFTGVDNRYLLNDEPQTILQIIKMYKPFYNDNKFMVFKKRDKPVNTNNSIIRSDGARWSKWATVPNVPEGLLRVKLTFSKSILQRIKSFLYKDEQFWIYLKLSNNIVHKYRIVPKNAETGLWINPYILNSANDINLKVNEIMFRSSNEEIMNQDLNLEWEKIEFENDKDYILNFFGKSDKPGDKICFSSTNTFEKIELNHWSALSPNQITGTDNYSGRQSHIIQPNSFSAAFSMPLDSLPFDNLKIMADCRARVPAYKYSNDIFLVLTIDDSLGNVVWKGLPIDEQLIDRKNWNNVFNFIDYTHEKKGCVLKAYIYNPSNKYVHVDDFRVVISGRCNAQY